MADSIKRKSASEGNDMPSRSKRSKGGTGGKWQTPHQRAKGETRRRGREIEPGDMGIWATCIKDKEGAATEELKALFDEYAERFYGDEAAAEKEDDENSGDIESSIQKEVASAAVKEGLAKLFTPVFLDVPCLVFFKTRQPIEPVEFVHRICMDAANKSTTRTHRFVNRLTPIVMTGKATEKGLEEVARKVLQEQFRFTEKERDQEGSVVDESKCSYAIRPTIRAHSTLTRDTVIKIVASIMGSNYRVDLTRPDKVIIVEIYQKICGMSVVGSDWEALKRFNLAEIHQRRA